MATDPVDPIERATWTSELVYGTLTVLIAIAGVEIAGASGSPTRAGAIILVGAVATWLAHAYATLLGRRAILSRSASSDEVGRALRHAWPIVLAAIPAVIAVGGATVGLWSADAALAFANIAAIAVLAGAGWLASQTPGRTVLSRITSAAVTASFGLAIVAMELLLHR